MEPSFEHFDHTADLGVRVRADTQAGLVVPAIDGLYAAIGGLTPAAPIEGRTLDFAGDDAGVLLRDLLAELLYLFESEGLYVVGTNVDVFDERRLRVHVQLARGPANALGEREVKAVTYHELAVRPTAEGFEAIYIVDI